MKQARIKCPHCGHSITVRQADGNDIKPEHAAEIWAAADEAFKAIDKMFRKLFEPLRNKLP